MVPALLVGHILGVVLWVSGLLVTSMALTRHTQEASAEARHALARLDAPSQGQAGQFCLDGCGNVVQPRAIERLSHAEHQGVGSCHGQKTWGLVRAGASASLPVLYVLLAARRRQANRAR